MNKVIRDPVILIRLQILFINDRLQEVGINKAEAFCIALYLNFYKNNIIF